MKPCQRCHRGNNAYLLFWSSLGGYLHAFTCLDLFVFRRPLDPRWRVNRSGYLSLTPFALSHPSRCPENVETRVFFLFFSVVCSRISLKAPRASLAESPQRAGCCGGGATENVFAAPFFIFRPTGVAVGVEPVLSVPPGTCR